jgi:hypothetical protein
MPVEAFNGNGVVSKLKILRDDLSTCCIKPRSAPPNTGSTRA